MVINVDCTIHFKFIPQHHHHLIFFSNFIIAWIEIFEPPKTT